MSARPLVLCLEDDPFVLKALVLMLKALDCDVLSARTAEEALGYAREGAIRLDILLADVILPVMDGVKVYQAIKRAQPGMDAMFISGTSREALIAGKDLPPEAPYLQKPFGFDGLEACLLPLMARQECA